MPKPGLDILVRLDKMKVRKQKNSQKGLSGLGHRIIREPLILLETVSMLYKYINGLPLQTEMNLTRERVDPATFEILNRRAGWIQEIMYKVCKGLDQTDPMLQKYFGKLELADVSVCLARYMTNYLGMPMKHTGFWESVQALKEYWREIRRQDLRISPQCNSGYGFTDDKSLPEDLFLQIKGMNLPAEFKLELYETMRDYENNLQALAQWMEPYARRLEECYRQESWLVEEAVEHWRREFEKIDPIDFVRKIGGESYVPYAAEETMVGVSLMNSHQIIVATAEPGKSLWGDYNIIIIGACLTTDSIARKKTRDMEHMGAALKYLGDRRRLEILRRLSQEQGYGLELAESMGMDSGNMSRTLSQLHQLGFLKQEKGSLRNYYKTDREAVLEFLRQVGIAIVGEDRP